MIKTNIQLHPHTRIALESSLDLATQPNQFGSIMSAPMNADK